MYFLTNEHLFVYDGEKLEILKPRGNAEFRGLHKIEGKVILQEGDNGLFVLEGQSRNLLPGSKDFVKGKSIVTVLASSKEGGLWKVFTQDGGIYEYRPEKGTIGRSNALSEKENSRGSGHFHIKSACKLDSAGNLYGAAYAVGCRGKGIYLLDQDGRQLLHIGSKDGLPSGSVWDLEAIKGKGLWASMNSGVAFIHTGSPFMKVGRRSFEERSIMQVTRFPDGDSTLLVGTDQGMWKWSEEDRVFEQVPGTEDRLLKEIHTIHSSFSSEQDQEVDKSATNKTALLTSTYGEVSNDGDIPNGDILVLEKEGEASSQRLRAETFQKGLGTDFAIFSLPQDHHEGPGIWKGALFNGREELLLSRLGFVNDQLVMDTLFTIPSEELPGKRVRVSGIHVDRRGPSDSLSFWGDLYDKGVLRVIASSNLAEGGYRIAEFDTSDGLPQGQIQVFPDPNGKGVLFGTRKGLYAFDGGRFIPSCRYGERFCNGKSEVYDLSKGVNGEVWLQDGTGSGGQVKHLIPEKEREGYRIDSSVFHLMEIGDVERIFPEKDRTWMVGDKGTVCYFPEADLTERKIQHCLVRKVSSSDDSLLFAGNYRQGKGSEGGYPKWAYEQPRSMVPELPYFQDAGSYYNHISFQVAAPYPHGQEQVVYSYKLEGFNKEWSDWGSKTKKPYYNLPVGDYVFKAKAKNIFGQESDPASYRFTILPPWYRTWTAYGGYTIAGIGLIWLIVRLNSRRLMAQKERLERTVEERTKEIREQKELVEEQKKEVEEQQKETQKQKEKVEEAHEEITQSIDYAQKIQYALLQSEEHVSSHLPEHFILFKPQSQVSGDFYWAQEHKGYFYIAAVDCTGHGVPGVFMSMLGISQ
ncbi:MAG: triple tyrosine motif-containing protein, partial [Flavobacteriales bacterium]